MFAGHKFRIFKVLPLMAVLLAISANLSAQSRLIFPRLSSENDTFLGVAIVNPTGDAAPLTLTAYGNDGGLLAAPGLTNPVQISIPANQNFAQTTVGLFGNADLDLTEGAWFEASSPTDGLTGFFLFQNFFSGQDPSITLFDGSDLPPTAAQIIFNNVRSDQTFETELNVVNTGDVPVTIRLDLTVGSQVVATRNLNLNAKGAARLDPEVFFGASPVPDEAIVIVDSETSPSSIAGFQFVRRKGADLLGLNARAIDDQANVLYFPQLAVRGPFTTEIGVVNYSDEAVLLTISAHRPDGSLYVDEILGENPVVRALPAGGLLREEAAELFDFREGGLLDGWMKVVSSSTGVNGYISYSIPEAGSLAAVAFSQARTRAIFSHIAASLGFFTGVAVLNPGSVAANLRIVALDNAGTVLGSFNGILRPGERLSKLIDELIPQAAGQTSGLIWVESDYPVYLTSLFGTIETGTGLPKTLANIPAQVAPEGYSPAAGLEDLEVQPRLTFLPPAGQQQFLMLGGSGTAQWSVEGGEDFGTITSSGGVYSSPVQVPETLPVTVTALRTEGTAAASVDILDPQALFADVGLVQSVAYLSGLERLYTAELRQTGGAAQRGVGVQETSDIVRIDPDESRSVVQNYPDENIPKILPFEANDGQEFLLLVGRTGGRIIRLDPGTGQSVDILTGLNDPTAMAFDGAGDLVIAVNEIPPVRIVSREVIEGIAPASSIADGAASTKRGSWWRSLVDSAKHTLDIDPFRKGGLGDLKKPGRLRPPDSRSRRSGSFDLKGSRQGTSGVAVDQCTGDIYFSRSENNVILRFNRATGKIEIAVEEADSPGSLTAIYRRGVGCKASFQLLFSEGPSARISIYSPLSGQVQSWVQGPSARDLVLLSEENPYLEAEAVVFSGTFDDASLRGQGGNRSLIGRVLVKRLYSDKPENPPAACQGVVEFADFNLAEAVREALDIPEGKGIPCPAAAKLRTLVALERDIEQLDGIEFLTGLRFLRLRGNFIEDLSPIQSLRILEQLDLRSNSISDLGPLAELNLTILDLTDNLISDLQPLAQMESVRILTVARNGIVSVEDLAGLRNLLILDLAINSIRSLEGFEGLESLLFAGLGENQVSDLAPLADLVRLVEIRAPVNGISNLHPLSGLFELERINLDSNPVSTVSPLLENDGLGAGDTLEVRNTLLDAEDCPDLLALVGRGVDVFVSFGCSPSG